MSLYLLEVEVDNAPPELSSSSAGARWRVHISNTKNSRAEFVEIYDPSLNFEEELRKYLEEYPRQPILGSTNARLVSKDLKSYGRLLAKQIEASGVLQQPTSKKEALHIGIISEEDTSELQKLHWEVLEDMSLWSEKYQFASVCVARYVVSSNPSSLSTFPKPERFRILFVVARRNGTGDSKVPDIDPQLITLPIFQMLKKMNKYVCEGEMLRPASWNSLEACLRKHPVGYFEMVHFDMHGFFDSLNATAVLEFISETSSDMDIVPARKVAGLLAERGVSIANLNACGSARASSIPDGNLAYLFARQGISLTIAMSFDLLDTAARIFEMKFFEIYLHERDIYKAMQKGRQALTENKLRKAAFGTDIELDDYFVPCIYRSLPENPEESKPLRGHRKVLLSIKEALITAAVSPFSAYYKAKAISRSKRPAAPVPTTGIIGRGSTIAEIEQRVVRPGENVMFLIGPAGAGKSALLEHLKTWWKTTGFIEGSHTVDFLKNGKISLNITNVFYQLLPYAPPHLKSMPKEYDDAYRMLVNWLRSTRLLLVVDSADIPVAIDTDVRILTRDTRLVPEDQHEEFVQESMIWSELLNDLIGGQTIVIVASRSTPRWIKHEWKSQLCLELSHLSSQSAVTLARKVCKRDKTPMSVAEQEALGQIVHHLDYNPLAISIFLPIMLKDGSISRQTIPDLWLDSPGAQWPKGNLKSNERFFKFLQSYMESSPSSAMSVTTARFTLFWIAEFSQSLPSLDVSFWAFVIGFSSSIENGASAEKAAAAPRRDDPMLSMYRPEELRKLKLALDQSQPCQDFSSDLFHAGILIHDEDNPEGAKLHPLFHIAAQNSNFGFKDRKELAHMVKLRKQAYWRYMFIRARDIMLRGSSESSIWRFIIPRAAREFSNFLSAIGMAMDPEITSDEQFATFGYKNPHMNVPFEILDNLCSSQPPYKGPYSVVLLNALERCLTLPDNHLMTLNTLDFACRHANRLAVFALPSQICPGLQGTGYFTGIVHNLIARFKTYCEQTVTTSGIIYKHTIMAETSEAFLKIEQGQSLAACRLFETILATEPPVIFTPAQREAMIQPAIGGWLTALKDRCEKLPSVHQLMQRKGSIMDVLLAANACTLADVDKFSVTTKNMLDSQYYDVLKKQLALALPPRGKNFNVQLQNMYGAAAGIQLALGVEVDRDDIDTSKNQLALKKAIRSHGQVTSATGTALGTAASHNKLSEIALVKSDWKSAIHHVNEATKYGFPVIARTHLTYALCFTKLKRWTAARGHAIQALQIALKLDDRNTIPFACGSLAGIELGRKGHYTLLPKLLFLHAIRINYEPESPLEMQVGNRTGVLLRELCDIIDNALIPIRLGFNPSQLPAFSETFKPHTKWEEHLDQVLQWILEDIDSTVGDVMFGKSKITQPYYKEAEGLLFSAEPVDAPTFADSKWASMFNLNNTSSAKYKGKGKAKAEEALPCERGDKPTSYNFFFGVTLDNDLLWKLLGCKSVDLELIYEPHGGYPDFDEDPDSDDYGDSGDEKGPDEEAGLWKSNRCRSDIFLEALIPHEVLRYKTDWATKNTMMTQAHDFTQKLADMPKDEWDRAIEEYINNITGGLGPIDTNDIPGRKVSMIGARGHLASLITTSLEALAKKAPDVSFIHSFPGPVKTDLAKDATGIAMSVLKGVFAVIGPFVSMPHEECGERHLFLATSARYPPSTGVEANAGVAVEKGLTVARGTKGESGSGVYSVNAKGESAGPKVEQLLARFRKDGVVEKVWDSTVGEFNRITGTEAA